MADLVRSRTRGLFLSCMVTVALGAIQAAFYDEGVVPVVQSDYSDSSQRRETTQRYLEGIDWGSHGSVDRFFRAAAQLLDRDDVVAADADRFWAALRRDGYERADDGEIRRRGRALSAQALGAVRDPAVILRYLDEIDQLVDENPPAAIGRAKEAVESTAKLVLTERGVPFGSKDDLPKLAAEAQKSVGLNTKRAGPDGHDGVRKILGAVVTIANGLAEFRNDYGTGHGRTEIAASLRRRHAALAVNAAHTWCELLLDTLADPDAPWHTQDRNTER